MKTINLTLTLIGLLVFTVTTTKPTLAQKAKVRMNLEYLNSGDEGRYLSVTARTRVERRYQPVEGVTIHLYLIEPTNRGFMGNVVTTENGRGSILLPPEFYQALDTLHEFIFFARLEDHPDYVDNEIELEIVEVTMDVDFIDQDSVKLVRVSVKEKDSLGTRVPREEVQIKFLVERPFSLLPIGGDYTTIDEEGIVTIEFPTDLPGDSAGNVNLVIRIPESESYGNVEKRASITWGRPVVFTDESTQRSLWAAGANAPISLLVLVNSLIIGVWGIIFYIVFRIFQIRRAATEAGP